MYKAYLSGLGGWGKGRAMGNSQLPGMSDSEAQKITQNRFHVRKAILKVPMMSQLWKWCVKDG